jgi:hypothetical protein
VRRLRLGWPGALGALLIVAGIGFLALVLSPLERHLAGLLEQGRKPVRADARLIAVSASQDRLARFYRFFERRDSITDHLARLHGLARHSGVEPRIADYRLADSGRLRVQEYTISMPVRGGYGEIRTFLESALEQIPVLTLDHVSLRRKRVTDHQVEADVRFTVFVSQP